MLSSKDELPVSEESLQTEYVQITCKLVYFDKVEMKGNETLNWCMCGRKRKLKILVMARECVFKLKFEIRVMTRQEYRVNIYLSGLMIFLSKEKHTFVLYLRKNCA